MSSTTFLLGTFAYFHHEGCHKRKYVKIIKIRQILPYIVGATRDDSETSDIHSPQ